MAEIFPGNNAFKIKALAVYQIVFGFWGTGFTAQFIIPQIHNLVFVAIAMVFIFLYAYSIYCGILLFKKRLVGLTHSLINQYLQLVFISVTGYAFSYSCGIYILCGFDVNDGMLTFRAGLAEWNLQLGAHSNEIFVGCNLVALLLIIFITKLKNKIAAEQEMSMLAIGEEV